MLLLAIVIARMLVLLLAMTPMRRILNAPGLLPSPLMTFNSPKVDRGKVFKFVRHWYVSSHSTCHCEANLRKSDCSGPSAMH